jgi:hypothetical protein
MNGRGHYGGRFKGYQGRGKGAPLSLERPRENYIFRDGSSLRWAIAKPKIQTEFLAAGVWDYVDCPAALFPVAPVGGGNLVFPEVALIQVEPTVLAMVTNRMVAYNAAIQGRFNQVQGIIALAGLPADEELKKIVDNELKLAEDESKRIQTQDRYQQEYELAHTAWLNHQEKDNAKASKCLSIFQKCIGPSSLAGVMNLLHERRFRQAWYQLNEFFSAANGGRESRSAMFDILANVTWNGRDFNGHVEYMTTLYDEVTEAGFPIDEEMKYEYLKKSILRSPNKMFNSILEFADYADNHNYTTLLAKLQIRASADELNNHKDKKIGTNLVNNFTNMNVSENPSNTVNNKSVTVTNPDKNSNSAKLFVLSRNNPNKDHICSLCGK